MAKTVDFVVRIKGADGKELQALNGEAQQLDKAFEQINNALDKTGDKLKNLSESSLVLDVASRSLGQLQSMVSGLAAPFNSFETAMRSANTMAGKSGAEFDAMTETISKMSKTIPLAREELANGLYQVISNGVPEDNWINFLEQSSRAAVGGIADLGQTVTVTSTLIKNYGLEWDQAMNIQDKIQTTAKNGVTSFEQLGQALPRVSGSAAQLGVSIDELMAVFATTTGVTGNTAEVSTQLAAVLNSLIKPSAEATKAAEEMGIGFNASSVQAAGGLENFLLGLDSSISEYAAKTGQLSDTIYGKLFGSAEALRLLGSLTGEQKEKFTENITAMADSTGAIDEAFQEMSTTGESANQMMRNSIQSMMDWAGSLASTAAPYTEMAANTGMALMSTVQLSQGLHTLMASLKGVSLATMAQSAAAKVAAAASTIWKGVQAALNFVLSANPIGIVVTAIGALVAAVVLAYNNCEGFREVCDKVWSAVKAVASAVWDTLVKAFEKASEVIKKAWEWIKKFFGIKDKGTAQQTADVEANTRAVERNTAAKAANAQAALKANRANNAPTSSSGSKKSGSKSTLLPFDEEATTLAAIENNVKVLQASLQKATLEEAAEINQSIRLWEKKAQAIKDAGEETKVYDEKASTLKTIRQNIDILQARLQNASEQEAAEINQSIKLWQEKAKTIEQAGTQPVFRQEAQTLKEIKENIQFYQNQLQDATVDTAKDIKDQLNYWKKLAEQIESVGDKSEKTAKEVDKIAETSQGLNGFGSILSNVGKLVDENTQSWLEWGTNVLNSIATAIKPISEFIVALIKKTTATKAASAAEAENAIVTAASSATIAQAKTTEATANAAAAATGAGSSVASIPWVGPVLAVAAIASVIAALANIPKFASGGIAYGPTLGIFGEYSGAANNPEVVAPLDRLRNIIGGEGGVSGDVEFKIRGRNLEGVLRKRANLSGRR